MKIDKEYKLREIADETILVKQGAGATDFTRIISLNSSARFLYEELTDKDDFTLQDVVALLVGKYETSEETAATDAEKWVKTLMDCGIIK